MPVFRQDVFTRAIRRAEVIAEISGTNRETLRRYIIDLMESAGARTEGGTFENNGLHVAIMLLAELENEAVFEMGKDA